MRELWKRWSRSWVLAFLALVVPSSLAAQTYSFDLDVAATEIRFVVDSTLHKVHGTAQALRGSLRIDTERGEAEGQVVVDARSFETGNARRDKQMHQRVLESDDFPELVLIVDGLVGSFEPGSGGVIRVLARLRIHGEEHSLTLPVTLDSRAGRLHARTTFLVPYVEWGLEDPSRLLLRVAKEVEVSIDASGELIRLP